MKRLAGSLFVVIALFSLPLDAQILDSALKARMAASPAAPLRVIATFDHAPTALDRSLITTVASRSQFLTSLPMALLETNAAGLTRLLGTPGLKSLYLDEQLQYFLHESVALIGADRARAELGADGKGIGIAVIDSGIDATHPDLKFGTKVVQNVKIVGASAEDSPTGSGLVQVIENLPNSDTSSGHGTHCASTAAGSRDGKNALLVVEVSLGHRDRAGGGGVIGGTGLEQADDLAAAAAGALDDRVDPLFR